MYQTLHSLQYSMYYLQNILNLCFVKKSINDVAFIFEAKLALYENVIFMDKTLSISIRNARLETRNSVDIYYRTMIILFSQKGRLRKYRR